MLRLAGVFFPWALSCLISSISVYLPLSCFICSRLARVCSSVSARCFNSPWILWSYAYQFVIRRSTSAGRAKALRDDKGIVPKRVKEFAQHFWLFSVLCHAIHFSLQLLGGDG